MARNDSGSVYVSKVTPVTIPIAMPNLLTRLDIARPKLAASASTVITLPFLAILGLSEGWPVFLATLVLAVGGVLLGALAPKSRGTVIVAAFMVVVGAFGIA